MKTYNNGTFSGRYDSSVNLKLWQVMKWKLLHKPQKAAKVIPLPRVDQREKLSQKGDFICWLSHASFLIQLGGKRILIDPVLNDIPFYKRQIPAPYSVEALLPVDYLLVSHTHYDHFDVKTLKRVSKCHPKAILPLKMGALMQKKVSKIPVEELDWFACYEKDGLKITLVPAKHWGRRGLFDKNSVLWGGYILQYANKTIYFAGDTAPGEHFKAIGKRFDIDIALLPIGAYKPEFIMKHNHLNPQEAFDAFKQLSAKKMIPMHYGTFELSDEPLDEPLQWIDKISKSNPGKIEILKAGEVLSISD